MPAISTKLLSLICMGNHSVVWLFFWLINNKIQPSRWLHYVEFYIFIPTLRYFYICLPKLEHPILLFPLPFCFFGSDLHAVQCGAGAAHTAGPEAALLRQGPVAQGQQLTAQPQVLPAQPWLKATLGVLSEQLAASADVLSSELWERRRAVSIVPGGGEKWHSTRNNSQLIHKQLHVWIASSSVQINKTCCMIKSHLASTAKTCCQTAAIPQALKVERNPLPGQIPVKIHNTKYKYNS